jgi:plasmid stabilization system protein ParE
MTVDFGHAAVADLAQAIAFYDAQEEGLGRRFAQEVDTVIEQIVRHPRAGVRLSKRARRWQTHRFPYGVFYRLRGDLITVVAIVDLRRDPETWRKRLQELNL